MSIPPKLTEGKDSDNATRAGLEGEVACLRSLACVLVFFNYFFTFLSSVEIRDNLLSK